MSMSMDDLSYEKCAHCWHFIEENAAYGDYPGLAEHVHLDNGEKEHDHDAEPSGDIQTLRQWRAQHPELFITYADDAIGPNSAYFTLASELETLAQDIRGGAAGELETLEALDEIAARLRELSTVPEGSRHEP